MATTQQSPTASRTAIRVPLGIVVAAVVAGILNVIVAAIAHAAGAADVFPPLQPGPFLFFTVIGVLIATGGWAVVRRTRRAASTLRWLVPVALLVSLVPDVLVGIGKSQPGTSWTAVVALMVMHVVVTVVSVAMLTRVLPVDDRD